MEARLLAPKSLRRLVVVTAAALVLLPAAAAEAGRVLVTGHDTDLHCGEGDEQCGFVEVATNYVRGGAPDPSKPVLVLDNDQENGPGEYDMAMALDNAFGAGVVPYVVMEPQSSEWASAPLRTDLYSAILVASDYNCGGCDLNPPVPGDEENTLDSDAINARSGDIAAFFNAGGGIFANAGDRHGNGDPSDGADVFYNFVPIPVGGVEVTSPFCLTPEGVALGFEDPVDTGGCPDMSKRTPAGGSDDINCCATHNSFAEPDPGTALKVAERDAENFPETLFAEGVIAGGRIVQPVDLAITKVDSVDPATVGRNLAYTMTITNNGPGPASGVTVTDDLPGELSARSATASQGSCSGTTVVTCSLGDMAAGASATVRIVVRPRSAGTITNTATVSSDVPDSNTANNTASQETRVRGAAARVDRRAPLISVGGVQASGCVRSAFTARVRIRDRSRLRRVTVSVDGRVVRRTQNKRFTVSIPASRMRAGRHVVRVLAVDRRGNRRVVRRSFRRCSPPVIAPVFTG